jgi:Arc/MetJ-type ribon-helix-helix transcriptional regulator
LHYNALEGELAMSTQLTVRLPDDLGRSLKRASRQMQRKPSEVVRLALREFLGTTAARSSRPADRVRRLIGSLESGIPDLASRHRAYILESVIVPESLRR